MLLLFQLCSNAVMPSCSFAAGVGLAALLSLCTVPFCLCSLLPFWQPNESKVRSSSTAGRRRICNEAPKWSAFYCCCTRFVAFIVCLHTWPRVAAGVLTKTNSRPDASALLLLLATKLPFSMSSTLLRCGNTHSYEIPVTNSAVSPCVSICLGPQQSSCQNRS